MISTKIQRRPILSVAIAVFALVVLPVAARATNYTITVDVTAKSTNPENPTVNLEEIDTTYVRIPGVASLTVTIGIVAFEPRVQGGARVEPDQGWEIHRDQFQLTFRPCEPESGAGWTVAKAKQGRQRYTTFAKTEAEAKSQLRGADTVYSLPCPSAVMLYGGMGWDVYAKKGTSVPLSVTATKNGKESTYLFAVQVEQRKFELTWSTGPAFLGTRDTRLRLEPTSGGTQQVVPLQMGSFPYRLAAFAHYTPIRSNWWSFCFGVATDVPVSGLTALLGLSLNAWTLPVVDSAHLSAGVMYGPRKRIRAEYENKTTVGSDVTANAMLEDRYGAAGFVALTFSFFGGESAFKGVFSGKGQRSGS